MSKTRTGTFRMVRAICRCRSGARAICLCALAFLCLALFAGCAQTTGEQYAGFLSDADVLMRFEICFSDIERGRGTEYTRGELRALGRDLEEGYLVDDRDAARTTELFQEAAEKLEEAYARENGHPSFVYEQARELYEKAWKLSVRVRSHTPAD